MALVTKNFSDIITFTRGSNATQFDSTGSLVYAPANLLTYSEDFGNAAWTKQASVSVATNTSVAPDGTTTGDTVTANSGSGVYQQLTVTVGTQVTQSIYIKAGTATSLMFRDDTGAGRHIIVNPSTGEITGTSGTLLNSGSVSVGNGWYRIYFSYAADATVVRGIVRPDSAGAGQTFLVWGGQTNLFPVLGGITSSLTTYYPTTTAAYYGPRFDYDPATLLARGFLIEESRTNSIRNNTMVGATPSTGIASASVAGGGTGYTLSDVLTVSGGTGTAATFTVTGVSSGVITSVSVTTAGNYTVFPTSPVSVTGGTGIGATFNIALNGTLPTTWTTQLNGLTQTVVGIGTVNGITYIDIRFNGTTSSAGTLQVKPDGNASGSISATAVQTWAMSSWVSIVGGSTANTTGQRLIVNEYSAGPTFLRSSTAATNILAGGATFTRVSGAITTGASTTILEPIIGLDHASGAAIDITLRIGLPQLENNNIATGVASATVASGGSGYAVGDVLQIVGGTGSTAARLTVATLSGSAVATVTVSTAGSYSVFPSPQPVSVTAITGTGTSATFNIVPQTQTGFATSVIPTTTAALTRSQDRAVVSTLSPWFNGVAGTIYAEFAVTQPASGANQFIARFSDNSYSNQTGDFVSSTGFAAISTASGGVFDGLASTAIAVAVNTVTKFAGAYATNDLAASKDGGAVATDPSATIPSGLTRFDLGSDHGGFNNIKAGYLRRITYYPRRLSNAELQAITA